MIYSPWDEKWEQWLTDADTCYGRMNPGDIYCWDFPVWATEVAPGQVRLSHLIYEDGDEQSKDLWLPDRGHWTIVRNGFMLAVEAGLVSFDVFFDHVSNTYKDS